MPDDNGSDAISEQAKGILSNPLGSGADIASWLDTLKAKWPLLSLQADAYFRLHDSADVARLPTVYPLSLIVGRLKEDEPLGQDAFSSPCLTPLERALDYRRAYVVGELHSWETGEEICNAAALEWDGSSNLFTSAFSLFDARTAAARAYSRARFDPADRDSIEPGFEALGRDFVASVEVWVTARDKNERQAAKAKVDGFKKDVAARLGVTLKRRMPDGPNDAILGALFNEAREFCEFVWELIPSEVNSESAEIFAGQGLEVDEDKQLWATRLALPLLSRPEVEALVNEVDEARAREVGEGEYPTGRRFAIWLLARRLGLQPESLARRVLDTDAPAYFQGLENPITEHPSSTT